MMIPARRFSPRTETVLHAARCLAGRPAHVVIGWFWGPARGQGYAYAALWRAVGAGAIRLEPNPARKGGWLVFPVSDEEALVREVMES